MLTNDEHCRNNLIHNNYIICQNKKQIPKTNIHASQKKQKIEKQNN